MAGIHDIPIIGQPRVEDYTIVFQVRCPCGTAFQMVGLIGASAKCSNEKCPNAFLVTGPAAIVPDMQSGAISTNLPLSMMRIDPVTGRPM